MKRSPLTKAIQAIGMGPKEFAEKCLELKYTTFCHRIRAGGLSLEDYHRIVYYTGRTFEELFPNPYFSPVATAPGSAQTLPRPQGIPQPPLAEIPRQESLPPVAVLASPEPAPVPVPPTVPPAPTTPKPGGRFRALDVGIPPLEKDTGEESIRVPVPEDPGAPPPYSEVNG